MKLNAARCVETWDVAVIGSGPAGALAARLIAKRGARVLLVEKRKHPRSKVCGACLNGSALAVLESAGLGSLVELAGGVPLDRLRIGLNGRESVFPMPEGRALSRSRFDADLVASAVEAGATLVQETEARVGAVEGGLRRIVLMGASGETSIAARVVVAATGLGGRALESDDAIRTEIAPNARVGAGCAVRDFPPEYARGFIHMAVGRRGYVGLTRTEEGSLNVAAAFDRDFLKGEGPGAAAVGVLNEAGFEPIAALGEADWRGTPSLTRKTTPVAGERVLLIGDATGYVEPFTGEGMAWGLSAAAAVAPLAVGGVEGWHPAIERAWISRHALIVERRRALCRLLAATLRRPILAETVFRLAASVPRLPRVMMAHLNRSAVSP